MKVKKYIYPVSLIVCLMIVLMLAVSCDKQQPGETQNENTYYILAQYYRQQYNDISTEHYNLQVEYLLLDSAYKSALQTIESMGQITQAVTPDLAQAQQITQLQGEIANLRVALQAATDATSPFEQRFYKSQQEYFAALEDIEKEKAKHQVLLDRMAKVTARTDITTSTNLTPEKRANFYEMWDLWIKTVGG